MVDDNGVARLGGLGSAFSLSLPGSCQSDVGLVRPPRDAAPELITPHAFGFVHVRITKATDMFDFGMLAQEVGRSLLYLLLSGHSFILLDLGFRRKASARQKGKGSNTLLGVPQRHTIAAHSPRGVESRVENDPAVRGWGPIQEDSCRGCRCNPRGGIHSSWTPPSAYACT